MDSEFITTFEQLFAQNKQAAYSFLQQNIQLHENRIGGQREQIEYLKKQNEFQQKQNEFQQKQIESQRIREDELIADAKFQWDRYQCEFENMLPIEHHIQGKFLFSPECHQNANCYKSRFNYSS